MAENTEKPKSNDIEFEKPEYQTEWKRKQFYTEAGSPIEPEYKITVDEKGETVLKEVGKTNVYEKIQAQVEETKIENILKRFMETGDASLLNKTQQNLFIDTTQLPQTTMELHQIAMEADNMFKGLSREIQKEFNFDPGQFKAAVLNGTLDQRLEKLRPKQEKQEKQEKIEGEITNES